MSTKRDGGIWGGVAGCAQRVNNVCQRAYLHAVHWLGVHNVRVVDRFTRWLGWRRFVDDEMSRPHAPNCARPNVVTLTRVGGSVKRCETCGKTVGIKFACWETEEGFMPEDVVKWLAEELERGEAP